MLLAYACLDCLGRGGLGFRAEEYVQCIVTESVATGVSVHAITIVKKISTFKKESSFM